MSLAPGAKLGCYEVLAPLGAGGMGELYRARDAKLNRDVALKVLPESFANDPDRLARFKREAQVLASLNHPNIAGIYGLEDTGAIKALVLELVEGPTLAERLAQGSGLKAQAGLPLDEVLSIARQIADALEAAHEQGIIHRDLKPANIKVRADGAVKVLDFGLAKALEQGSGIRDRGLVDATQSPTITSPAMMTGVGVILGTAAYMSPEQAKGKPTDKRADIWAYGVVLYEMLTGERPFDGETVSDVLALVITKNPDLNRLPAKVRNLIEACLEKDPKRRLRDIGDAGRLLKEGPAGVQVRPWWRRPVPASIAALLAAGLGATIGLAVWTLTLTVPQSRPAVARITIPLPAAAQLASSESPALAISADGSLIAYVGTEQGRQQQLYLRALESLDSRAVPGTEGATNPFFSPDGQWVGFFAQGKLKRVSVDAGAIQTVCDAPLPRGGSWAADDTIYFTPLSLAGLWRVPASGGTPQEVTRLDRDKGEISHR